VKARAGQPLDVWTVGTALLRCAALRWRVVNRECPVAADPTPNGGLLEPTYARGNQQWMRHRHKSASPTMPSLFRRGARAAGGREIPVAPAPSADDEAWARYEAWENDEPELEPELDGSDSGEEEPEAYESEPEMEPELEPDAEASWGERTSAQGVQRLQVYRRPAQAATSTRELEPEPEPVPMPSPSYSRAADQRSDVSDAGSLARGGHGGGGRAPRSPPHLSRGRFRYYQSPSHHTSEREELGEGHSVVAKAQLVTTRHGLSAVSPASTGWWRSPSPSQRPLPSPQVRATRPKMPSPAAACQAPVLLHVTPRTLIIALPAPPHA
jgi:hypothetical protein